MAIQISKALIKKLPEKERKDAQKRLWDKSGGFCFLCEEKMVESAEKIVADHDVPDAEGGKTDLSNLNLTHFGCNSFKRCNPTVDVRPFLKLRCRIKAKGGFVKYDEAIKLLKIVPLAVDMVWDAKILRVTTADKKSVKYPVFTELNKEGEFRFAFVEIDKCHMFNDDECQPRTIKLQHLWQIYNDICRNPLHEAPTCRVKKVSGTLESYKLLLFDGQHKSLAFWINNRGSVVVKLYLDISKEAAVRLVNSIQSKIKKLPLSPFELAAKMSEEWQERVADYEKEEGLADGSEDGFIRWVEKDQRSRAKSAFSDALFQNIIDTEDFEFKKIVLRQGQKGTSEMSITEAAFKNKVLKPLLHMAPLTDKFDRSKELRVRESNNIVALLNLFYEQCFTPNSGSEMTPQENRRRERISYQSALQFVAGLLRQLFAHVLSVGENREFLEKEPSSAKWEEVEKALEKILSHPVWTADFSKSVKMKRVRDALQKNQDAAKAFLDVSLNVGYALGADSLRNDCLD
jgi:hypothetical protein